MYCIKCGVKLADTEKKCPLCSTPVCHPDFQIAAEELYPAEKMPKSTFGRAFLSGAVLIMFMIPLVLTFFSDIQIDGELDWFGYVAGALVLAYIIFALPTWFKNPNPVIFVPCGFAAVAVYLLFVCIMTSGNWFLSLALPVVGGLALIVTAVVALVKYVKKGKLFIFGGAGVALGAFMLPIELLVNSTFGFTRFVAWSMYPLISLVLIGGLLIFLGIYRPARELMEQKFFF